MSGRQGNARSALSERGEVIALRRISWRGQP